MQKSSLSMPYVQRKRVFFGGRDAGQTLPRTLNGPCLGRPGNFKICRGNPRLPNTVGKQICKKVLPELNDPEQIYWLFIAIFAIPREPLKLRQHVSKVFWRHIVCSLKGAFVMSDREKTILLQNSGFIQRLVERKQNTAENSFCIKNSTKSKTFKNVGKKTQHVFGGPGGKFFWTSLSFFVFKGPYH